MSDNLTAVLISLGCTLGPLWVILHYKYKFRSTGALSATDSASLDQLAATAARLDQRVATLERILDSEVPAWRSNFDTGQYGRQAG